jgi:hypothetical protein
MADTIEQEISALRLRLAAVESAMADEKVIARELIEILATNTGLMHQIETEISALIDRATAASAELNVLEPKFTAIAEAAREAAKRPDGSE